MSYVNSPLLLCTQNHPDLKGRGIAFENYACIFVMQGRGGALFLKYMPVLASCQTGYVGATSCNIGGVDTTEKNRQWMIDLLHPVWIILGGLTDTN